MLAGAAAATAAAASRRHAIAAICVLTAMTVAVSAVFVALHTLPTSWRSHAAHDDASGDDKSDGKSDSTSSSLLLLLLATVLVMSVVTYMVVAYVTTHTALSRLHAQLLQQSAVLCEQRLLLEALLHRQQQQQQQQSEQPRQSLVPLPAAQATTPAAEHSNNKQGGDDSNMASVAAPTPAFCPRDDKDRAAMQTTHASRYKILRHIGHGSFASVYLVEDKATGQRYALKYLVCLDDHRRVAALRECETIHSVQGHPNVIRIVDMFMGYDFAAQQQQQQQQQQTQRSGAMTTTRTTSSALQQTRPQWTHVKLRQDTERTRERPQQEQVPQTQQLAQSHEVLLPLQILSDADTECLMREARRQRERRRHEQQQRTATSDGRNATHEVAVSDKPHAVAAATTTATMLSRQQTQQQQQQQQQARRLPHALSSSSSSSRLVRPLSSSVATATHTACSDASGVHDSAHNATAAAAAVEADTQREHTQQQQQLAKTREPCALLPPGSTPRVSYAPGGGVRYTDFVVNAANAAVTTTTSPTTRTRDCTDMRVVQLRDDDDDDDCNRGGGVVAATSTPVHSMTAAAAAATTTTRTAHYRNFAPATDVVPPRSLNDGAAYTRTVSVVDLTTTLPELHRCDGDAHGAADTHTDTRTSAQAAAAQRGTSAASSSNNTTHASHTTHDSNSTTAAAAAAVTVRPSGYLCLVVEYHAMGDLSQYVQRLLATRVRVGGDGSGSCSVTAAAAVLDSSSDTDADDDDATRHNPLTETQLLSIAYQLSSVLCHLHAQRPPIVHRDLKPENILIKGEPRQLRLRPLPPTPRLSSPALRAHTRATTATTTTITATATRPPASPVSSSGGNTNMMCATDALAAAAAAVSPSCSGSSSAATTHLDTTSVDAAVTHGRITRRFIPVVVTDFGLAMTQEAHRRPGRGGGTRPYISPESWSGKTTTASDMWSLGCVLYALATGRLTERTVRVMATEAMQTTFAQTILNDLLQEQYSLLFGTFVLSLLVLDPSKRLTAAAATRCFCVRRRSGSGGSNNDDDDEDDDTEVRFDTSCPFFSNMLDL